MLDCGPMRSLPAALLIVVSAFLSASCAPSPPPAAAPAASASADELGKMNRDFALALNMKDARAAASLYAEDAVLYPPGELPVRGRAAIEAYWKAGLEGGLHDVRVETIDAKSAGDLGYEVGSYVLTVNGADGKPITERGRYTELLRRNSSGAWISTMGMWNAEPAPPTRQ